MHQLVEVDHMTAGQAKVERRDGELVAVLEQVVEAQAVGACERVSRRDEVFDRGAGAQLCIPGDARVNDGDATSVIPGARGELPYVGQDVAVRVPRPGV